MGSGQEVTHGGDPRARPVRIRLAEVVDQLSGDVLGQVDDERRALGSRAEHPQPVPQGTGEPHVGIDEDGGCSVPMSAFVPTPVRASTRSWPRCWPGPPRRPAQHSAERPSTPGSRRAPSTAGTQRSVLRSASLSSASSRLLGSASPGRPSPQKAEARSGTRSPSERHAATVHGAGGHRDRTRATRARAGPHRGRGRRPATAAARGRDRPATTAARCAA